MPGFMPGIHVLLMCAASKTWMAGTSPAMTTVRLVTVRKFYRLITCNASWIAGSSPAMTS